MESDGGSHNAHTRCERIIQFLICIDLIITVLVIDSVYDIGQSVYLLYGEFVVYGTWKLTA